MFNPTHPKVVQTIKRFNSPLIFQPFLFTQLPAAWFIGLKIKALSLEKGEVTLRYSWFSKNPFRSIYFAALCAAGELSTGAIVMAITHGFDKKIAMLVRNIEAEFVKKAVGKCTFTCVDGDAAIKAISEAVATDTPQTVRMTSVATDESGEIIAKIYITWSFKAK